MRVDKLNRKTKETDINICLNLDGEGKTDIDTGIGFLDHMLNLFAYHGRFDLTVKCTGDLQVDGHHTVEDIGIVLGKLIANILEDKKGIARYSQCYIPMDESLCRCVLDISGRPFLSFNADLNGYVGNFDSQLTEEFFRAVTNYGLFTAHIDLIRGDNLHHKIESIFKAFGRALSQAVKIAGNEVPSSKGVIE